MVIVEIATVTTRPQVRGKIGMPEAGKPDKGVGGAVILNVNVFIFLYVKLLF